MQFISSLDNLTLSQREIISATPTESPSSVTAVKVLHDGGFTAIELCQITQAAVRNLKFLKDNKVVHANIKPETIHVQKSSLDIHYTFLQFVDTRYSRHFTQAYPEGGTVSYKPPEHLDETQRVGYVDKIDPWAAGVTLYILCTNDKIRGKFKKINDRYGTTKTPVTISKEILYPWIAKQRRLLRGYSTSSKMAELLYHLLDPDPKTRWSADEAIRVSESLKTDAFWLFFK